MKSDLGSFSALQQYHRRVLGFTYPEAELRQQWDSGHLGKQRDFPGYATIMAGMKKFPDIPVPALVIFAIPHSQGSWVDKSTDPKVSEGAKAYSAALTGLTESQAKALENGVPTPRVVRLRCAHHYVYLSNEADVLREMRSFLSGLRQTDRRILDSTRLRDSRLSTTTLQGLPNESFRFPAVSPRVTRMGTFPVRAHATWPARLHASRKFQTGGAMMTWNEPKQIQTSVIVQAGVPQECSIAHNDGLAAAEGFGKTLMPLRWIRTRWRATKDRG